MKRLALLAALLWAQSSFGAMAQSAPDYSSGFASPPSGATTIAPEPEEPSAGLGGGMRKIVLSSVPAPTVAELFTSEGCSSCPPADELLAELTERQFVLPLSYHVDYWDYIGWKDAYARPEFTRRQRAYAEVLGTRMVYTPQMIVAGAIDVVASDRKQVNKALKLAFTRNAMYRIEILQSDGGDVIARFPEAKIGVPATVWLVTYSKRVESDVTRGENAGRRLASYNVVKSIKRVGLWRGEALDLPISVDQEAGASEPDGCALIANQADYGPIVAAAAFDYHQAW
jgi:hypothetical protein